MARRQKGDGEVTAASRLDGLTLLYRLFSQTFGGKRDLSKSLGYLEYLTYDNYLARYSRDHIAGRIVDIPAEATWKALPLLTTDTKLRSETPVSRAFAALAKRVKLRQHLEVADRLAGIGRYSVLLLGFSDGRPLEEPVAPGSQLLYVAPFSEESAQPTEIDSDPHSPGFGSPLLYAVDFARGLQTTDPLLKTVWQRLSKAFQPARSNQRVHVSRLVHIAEGALEDGVFGVPRLRRVWDRMDDLSKAVGGSAEVFWLVANRGLQFDVDKQMSLSQADRDALDEQIEEYEHGLRRVFQTRGVQIKGMNELGAGNVNPRSVFGVIAALIVGTTGIPYRMLFGTERGQNISSQDRKAWLEEVDDRRDKFGNEVVLTPLVEKLVAAGALPPEAADAAIVWPPIHDDMHRAEVAEITARAELNHARSKQFGQTVSDREFRSLYFGLPEEMPKEPEAPRVEPEQNPDPEPKDKPTDEPSGDREAA